MTFRATCSFGNFKEKVQDDVLYDESSGCNYTNCRPSGWTYSAFNLEEPLLCFVVNKYVLCSEKVTIVAIGLKFAMSVHTSFRSVCGKSGLIMVVDSKVVAACVPGIGLQL